ncbi:MAG: hypothetical protein QM723_01835 [Myxococcaceae bacterium]
MLAGLLAMGCTRPPPPPCKLPEPVVVEYERGQEPPHDPVTSACKTGKHQ